LEIISYNLDLEVINRGAKRVSEIADRLLTLAAQYEAKRDYIDINRLIYSKDDLFTTILPIRDGISVSLRL